MSGPEGISRPDRLEQLYEISSHYAQKFPEGDSALGYLSRLAEELGEIAVEVQRLEGAPAKIAKHGHGNLPDLASEIEDLIHTALGLLQHYRAEAEFDAVVESQHRRIFDTDRRTDDLESQDRATGRRGTFGCSFPEPVEGPR